MKKYMLLAVVPIGLLNAAPFRNGSFESPGLTNPSTQLVLTGSELTAWTVSGEGTVKLLNGKVGDQQFDPVVGVHQINFSGGETPTGGTLSQTFDTVPGTSYTVSFYVGRVGPGGGSVGVTATVLDLNSNTIGELQVTPPQADGYGPLSQFSFVAATTTSTIRFQDTSSTTVSVDMALDAISVTPTANQFSVGLGFYATLEIEGRVGTLYRIEYSEDLSEWLTLTTLKLTSSPFRFTDENSKNRPKRFYRVAPLP
jgi:hypothetical protein